MAEFCKQCAEETFGPGTPSDFAGLLTETQAANGDRHVVLCEGCGERCLVDHNGVCQSAECFEKHGNLVIVVNGGANADGT